jgi:hypothetical protein
MAAGREHAVKALKGEETLPEAAGAAVERAPFGFEGTALDQNRNPEKRLRRKCPPGRSGQQRRARSARR